MAEPKFSYSADDLLRAADETRIPRSRPWIRTLVNDGLLDQPDNHGRPGRKGGRADGTWPEIQFRLYLAELDLMRQGVGRAELCHLPVGLWVRLGPDHVPVPQVKRALRTYSRYKKSRHQARVTAAQLAEFYAGANMSRNDRADLIAATARFDRDKFVEAASRVIDPENGGRTLGPPGIEIGPETHVRVIDAYLVGVDALDDADEFMLKTVREQFVERARRYDELRPVLMRDRDLGKAFAAIGPADLHKEACTYVFMILGGLILEHGSPSNNKLPPRPRSRPRGPAREERSSACSPSVPSRARPAPS